MRFELTGAGPAGHFVIRQEVRVIDFAAAKTIDSR